MADDRTKSGFPQAELPEQRNQVRPLRDDEVPRALVPRLVPVVDRIRQLYTRFGMRPYRVFLVHVKWSGTRIGEGQQHEISRREILPTPRLMDMSGTTEVMRAIGLSEEGNIVVNQITAKFSEDDLLGKTPDLQDPTSPRTDLPTVEFYYEVVENRASTPTPVRRRYVPTSAPHLSRDGFQWSVPLAKQDYDRGRRGGTVPRGTFN